MFIIQSPAFFVFGTSNICHSMTFNKTNPQRVQFCTKEKKSSVKRFPPFSHKQYCKSNKKPHERYTVALFNIIFIMYNVKPVSTHAIRKPLWCLCFVKESSIQLYTEKILNDSPWQSLEGFFIFVFIILRKFSFQQICSSELYLTQPLFNVDKGFDCIMYFWLFKDLPFKNVAMVHCPSSIFVMNGDFAALVELLYLK